MKQQRKLFIGIAIATLVLVVTALAAALPIAIMNAMEEESTVTPPSLEEGEGVKYNTVLLYGPFGREKPVGKLSESTNIKSISFTNEDETYSFVHPDEDNYTDFVIEQNGKVYKNLAVSNEMISEVVVSVGTPYVRVRVGENEGAEERYEEYGLSAEKVKKSYTLTLYNGDSYTVHIGNKTADQNGYYVRVEGRDIVYVTQTPMIGELVSQNAGAFVSPQLTPTPELNYSSYYIRDFLVEKETYERTSGTPVSPAASVGLRYTRVRVIEKNGEVESTDTESGVLRIDLSTSSDLAKNLRSALENKKIGDRDISVLPVVTVADGRTITSTYTVNEVLYTYTRGATMGLNFILDAEDRDYFRGGPLYEITAPASMQQYTPDTSTVMDFLVNMQTVTGISTVKLGITAEDMVKYGLYAATVRYDLPMTYKSDEVVVTDVGIKANTVTINDEAYKRITLYVSEKQKDGTYYVASPYYDIIATVSADTLPFLEYSSEEWVEDGLVSTYMALVKEVKFSFGYKNFDKEYVFDVAGRTEEKSPFGGTKITMLPMNGKRVDYTLLTEIYNLLYWTEYRGETGFTAEETNALIDSKTPALTVTFTLVDGKGGGGSVYEYRFIPYSETRALLVIEKDGDESNASSLFYVDTVVLKSIAYALDGYEKTGIVPDLSERYG